MSSIISSDAVSSKFMCAHGLTGPCHASNARRAICVILASTRRWLMRKDRQGWNRTSVILMWLLLWTFTALLTMTVVIMYDMVKQSPMEERMEILVANCTKMYGQKCEIELSAIPVVTSNISF